MVTTYWAIIWIVARLHQHFRCPLVYYSTAEKLQFWSSWLRAKLRDPHYGWTWQSGCDHFERECALLHYTSIHTMYWSINHIIAIATITLITVNTESEEIINVWLVYTISCFSGKENNMKRFVLIWELVLLKIVLRYFDQAVMNWVSKCFKTPVIPIRISHILLSLFKECSPRLSHVRHHSSSLNTYFKTSNRPWKSLTIVVSQNADTQPI